MSDLKLPAILLLGILIGLATFTYMEHREPDKAIQINMEDLSPVMDPSLHQVIAEGEQKKGHDLNTFEVWCNCFLLEEKETDAGGVPVVGYKDGTYIFYRANFTTSLEKHEITTGILNSSSFCPQGREIRDDRVIRVKKVRRTIEKEPVKEPAEN